MKYQSKRLSMIVNNKGQSLVAFVLLIPFISLLLIMVIDYGMMIYEKKQLDSVLTDSIEYGLNNIQKDNIKEDIQNLIYRNIDQDSISKLEITIDGEFVNIKIEKKFTGIINLFFNKINLSYQGKKTNDKIEIIKR